MLLLTVRISPMLNKLANLIKRPLFSGLVQIRTTCFCTTIITIDLIRGIMLIEY